MNYKNIVLGAAFLAVVGFAFVATAPVVKAADNSALIQQLMAQIASLQAQLAQLQAQQGTTQSWCHTFNVNLGVGVSGSDFDALITVLDKENISEFNSANRPTQYDEVTAGAVSALQQKYFSEILAPNGLKYPTGYVGRSTRAKLNSLYGCGTNIIPPPVSLLPIVNVTTDNSSGPIVPVQAGQTLTLAWTSTNAVSCYAYANSVLMTNSSDNYFQGKTSASVLVQPRFDTTYTIKCSNSAGQQASNSITLQVSSSAQPSITVTSPNGSKACYVGDYCNIIWTSSNVGNFPIEIDLIGISGVIAKTITTGLQNTGSYLWFIDSTIPSDYYTVLVGSQVREGTVGSASGRSGIFYIANSTSTQPSIISFTSNNATDGGYDFYWNTAGGDSTEFQIPCYSGLNITTHEGNFECGDVTRNLAVSRGYHLHFSNNSNNTINVRVVLAVIKSGNRAVTKELNINIPNISTQPSITVTSPNGGEQWVQGQTYNIMWSSANVPINGNIYIALVNDTLGRQYGITTTIGSSGSYTWTIPSTINYDSTLGNRFKISATYSPSYTAYTGTSANYFTIVAPTTSYSLNISSVTGMKSVYSPGERISFSVKGIELDGTPASNTEGFNVQAYVCKNGDCNNYLPPNPSTSYNGNYNSSTGLWDVSMNAPLDSVPAYSMRVVLYCSQTGSYCWNNYGGYGSSQVEKLLAFTVASPSTPSITVTSPNGGEIFAAGQNMNISWQNPSGILSSDALKISLFDYTSGNTPYIYTLATSLPGNTQSYTYAIPSTITPGSKFKIGVEVLRNGVLAYFDVSDNYFSIVATPPVVTLKANGVTHSITVVENTSVTFSWSSTNTVSCSSYGGYSNWAQSPRPTSGSIELRDPINVSSLFSISCASAAGVSTTSSVQVNVQQATQPSITVTSPNGGETLTIGQVYRVKWTYQGINSVYIYIDNNSGNLGSGSSNYITPNNTTVSATQGYYDWTPTTQQLGPMINADQSKYKIRVIESTTGNTDSSDSYFSIILPIPSITVTSPNGGETWQFGVPRTITWNSTGMSGTIGLYLSTTNGLACSIGSANVLDGMKTVTIQQNQLCPGNPYFTNLIAGQYKVMIDAAPATGIENTGDSSDNYFSIVVPTPSITVTSPNGGEHWTQGSSKTITWTGGQNANGTYSGVDIKLYTNRCATMGSSCTLAEQIFTITSGALISNSYAWQVGRVYGSNSLVSPGNYSVSVCVANTNTCDRSNSYFSIIAPQLSFK